MLERTYDRLKQIGIRYQGYVDTEQLKAEGLTNRQIGTFVEEGLLERISHGHYWLQCAEYSKPEDYRAIEVCIANPDAVICADSACYYQGLIEQEPQVLSVATLRSDRRKMQMNFPVARHYYSELMFGGFEKKSTKFGSYNIYDVERSVCDCFRFRNTLEDGMLELIVESYQNRKDSQLERLLTYAKILRIEKMVRELL